MSGSALAGHLATGSTTVCRCWGLVRRDGVGFGFTDHDEDLSFGGRVYRADSGLTARAVEQRTGLSVDNTEVIGILSDAAVRAVDIAAGRFDGAAVEAWLVNWTDVSHRVLQFRGTLGEIEQSDGSFRAELRGLSEILNEPQGLVYQGPCSAVLGDQRCGVDLDAAGMSMEASVIRVVNARTVVVLPPEAFDARWFERGRARFLNGASEALVGVVKTDRPTTEGREIEFWQDVRAEVVPGDLLRLEAGCDKQVSTCRVKFGNFLNFRGFPHVPGEDWQMAYPSRQAVRDGGSLNR